jgi:hypothetical protein
VLSVTPSHSRTRVNPTQLLLDMERAMSTMGLDTTTVRPRRVSYYYTLAQSLSATPHAATDPTTPSSLAR